jgi:ATP-dependent DNA helicase PIF1
MAGTGKTFFITQMLLPANQARRRPFKIALTAPTGVAASLLGGVTIHSWAGLGFGMNNPHDRSRRPGDEPPTVYEVARKLAKQLFNKPEKLQEIRETDILLMDEISMVGDQLLDLTDNVLRIVRGNVYAPFGGMRVIFVGDTLQLAPVSDKWFFYSNVWSELCGGADPEAPSNIDFYVFKQCRRFDEPEWFHLLSRVRVGQMTYGDEQILKKRRIKPSQEEQLSHLIYITGKKVDVEAENLYRQNQLPGKDYVCRARDYLVVSPGTDLPRTVLDTLEKHFKPTTPNEIVLRVGARVMLRVNLSFDECLVNGSTGEVVRIETFGDPKTSTHVRKVLVQFDPLIPTIQAMFDRRRAQMTEVAQLTKQGGTNIVVNGNESGNPNDTEPGSSTTVILEQKSESSNVPPDSDPKMEEDRSQRRIWITPFTHKVKFHKQMLGIRRTVIAPFSVEDGEVVDKDDPDSVLDVPPSDNAVEDEKLRQLALSRGSVAEVARDQIPLVLAWSTTSHRCQGTTMVSGCKLNLGKSSVFTSGQAYVMLSRCPSLEGVYLTDFDASKVYANREALTFVSTFGG